MRPFRPRTHTMHTRMCRFCGGLFDTVKRNTKFCGLNCRVTYHRRLHLFYPAYNSGTFSGEINPERLADKFNAVLQQRAEYVSLPRVQDEGLSQARQQNRQGVQTGAMSRLYPRGRTQTVSQVLRAKQGNLFRATTRPCPRLA